MKGWVYVITNEAMEGLVKVGYSTKDPDLRVQAFNSEAAPHPYVVEYEMLIKEPRGIEQAVHKILSNFHERKEWFRCAPEEAVAAIRQAAGNKQILENFKYADRKKTKELRHKKDELHYEKKAQKEQNRHPNVYKLAHVQTVRTMCSSCGFRYSVTMTRYENKSSCPNGHHNHKVNINW